MKRVYHPTLNSWADVEDGAVKDWTDAGYKSTKPKHVDDSAALPPGEGYTAPEVVDTTGNAAAYLNAPEAKPAKAGEK